MTMLILFVIPAMLFSSLEGRRRRYLQQQYQEIESSESNEDKDQSPDDEVVEAAETTEPTPSAPPDIDESDEKRSQENKHLFDLAEKEIASGNIDSGIDCMLALAMNIDDENTKEKQLEECAKLCEQSDSKEKAQLGRALMGYLIASEDLESVFQKARKHTAKRDFTRARDVFLALYLSDTDEARRFDYIYRCGMISLQQRRFYLARGFFRIALESLSEKDVRWARTQMKIARCEDAIDRSGIVDIKNKGCAKKIIEQVMEIHPNYRPTDEVERKIFDSIYNQDVAAS